MSNTNNRFYGELSLAVKADSKQAFYEFESRFNEDGLRIKITLESGDGSEIAPEVLEVWKADWEDWEAL